MKIVKEKDKLWIVLIVSCFWLLTLLIVVKNGYSLKLRVKGFFDLELTKNPKDKPK